MYSGRILTEVTHRQLEALQLYADGYAIKQIAAELGIEYSTAKNILYEAHRNLGAKSSPHAVAIAIRQKLIV